MSLTKKERKAIEKRTKERKKYEEGYKANLLDRAKRQEEWERSIQPHAINLIDKYNLGPEGLKSIFVLQWAEAILVNKTRTFEQFEFALSETTANGYTIWPDDEVCEHGLKKEDCDDCYDFGDGNTEDD
jgi:hypothetical protein